VFNRPRLKSLPAKAPFSSIPMPRLRRGRPASTMSRLLLRSSSKFSNPTLMNLTAEKHKALYALSRYPEYSVLKEILADWAKESNSVSDIDLNSDVAAQVAGRQHTMKMVDTLLGTLNNVGPAPK